MNWIESYVTIDRMKYKMNEILSQMKCNELRILNILLKNLILIKDI